LVIASLAELDAELDEELDAAFGSVGMPTDRAGAML
jgi:hypothetical protein